MANTYAADFGDVVKHTVLCEVLRRERPMRYLESHGGRLDYDLAELEPGPGGVWDFIERSAGSGALASSAYTKIVLAVAGSRELPGLYPGSVALASELLPAGAEIVVFELVAASASSLQDGLASRGRPAQVQVADGLSGVSEWARPGDFVLLDPFHVHERGERFTSAEVFAVLASCGVRTLLWYAIHEPNESTDWVTETTKDLPDPTWHVRLIGDRTEGGLAGCGFLAAHLSPDTITAATGLVEELSRALADVRSGLRLE